MAKRIKLTICQDGTVKADVAGIKGSRCTMYIKLLEDLLDAECFESAYNPEFFETEELKLVGIDTEILKNREDSY